MALAGARHARERAQTPRLGKICGDGILDAMYGRMDVIATFQPGGELWVRTTASIVRLSSISKAFCTWSQSLMANLK